MSVDLPAPFSPTKALTSPDRKVDIVQGNHTRERLGYAAGSKTGSGVSSLETESGMGLWRFAVHNVQSLNFSHDFRLGLS